MHTPEDLMKFVHRHETLFLNISRPNNGSVPVTLEPQRTSDSIACTVASALYDGLVRCKNDGQLVLSQADSFEVLDRGKIYLFTLKRNCWSDGSPVTALDFVNTWRHLLSKKNECPNFYYFHVIKNAKKISGGKMSSDQLGVAAIDEWTLKVELERPLSFFLDLLAARFFTPLHHSSIDGFRPQARSTFYPLVSNGPYHLSHWNPNVELVLEKNPYFHGASGVSLNRIQVNFIDNDLRLVDFFLTRKIDAIVKNYPVVFKHKAIKHLIHQGEVQSGQLAAAYCCVFNCKTSPFKHLKLRKAFSMAIDRPKILKRLTMLGEEPADSLLPPVYRPDYRPPEFSKFDLLQARSLFKEALEELKIDEEELSENLVIHYPHSEFYYNLAEELREGWKFIFDVELSIEESSLYEMTRRMAKREFSMGLLSWIPTYHHPLSFLERFRAKNIPKNYSHWSTKEFTKILERATYAKTREESWDYCRKADEIIKEELPIAPIFYGHFGKLLQPYVKSFNVSPLGIVNYDELSFDQEMLVERPFPEHPLAEELIEMLQQSVAEPLRKVSWYGVNFTSPYEDSLCSRHDPDL